MGFVCKGSHALDFSNDCVRSFWSTLLPAVLVFLLTLSQLPFPSPLRKLFGRITSPLTPFLTLAEAEALDAEAASGDTVASDEDAPATTITPTSRETHTPGIPLWRTIVLVWLALAETLVWLSISTFSLLTSTPPITSALALVTSLSWLYATIRPIAKPQPTLPFDLLSLYLVHVVVLILKVGGAVYDVSVLGLEGPNGLVVVGWVADGCVLAVLVGVLWWCPLGIPSGRVDRREIVSTCLVSFVEVEPLFVAY